MNYFKVDDANERRLKWVEKSHYGRIKTTSSFFTQY